MNFFSRIFSWFKKAPANPTSTPTASLTTQPAMQSVTVFQPVSTAITPVVVTPIVQPATPQTFQNPPQPAEVVPAKPVPPKAAPGTHMENTGTDARPNWIQVAGEAPLDGVAAGGGVNTPADPWAGADWSMKLTLAYNDHLSNEVVDRFNGYPDAKEQWKAAQGNLGGTFSAAALHIRNEAILQFPQYTNNINAMSQIVEQDNPAARAYG